MVPIFHIHIKEKNQFYQLLLQIIFLKFSSKFDINIFFNDDSIKSINSILYNFTIRKQLVIKLTNTKINCTKIG